MKGDIPLAAFRLLTALPVRTHERTFERLPIPGNANNVRPVIVGGVQYESLTEAARQLKMARETLRNRIYKGTARYA